jgi:putative transcriptional regulator
MNKFSKELIESLTEACEHAEGKPSGVRIHVVDVPDARAIRRQLRMSQQEFARVYRIPLATLKNWEQGRRQPDAPAAAYLQAIAERRVEDEQKTQVFEAIGQFIFWFSQLEFTIRVRLSAELGLEEQLFDVVIAPYDFAVLCTVTSTVLTHKHPEGEADFKRIFNECRRLNDERVRIAHGTWTHGSEGLSARDAARRTLEAKYFYEKPEALVQLSQTAERLMREVIQAPRQPKGESKHTAAVG